VNGAASSDPRIDITGVTLVNEPDHVDATISVSQVVPFSDPAWDDGSLGIAAVLDDPATDVDAGTSIWYLFAFNGHAVGVISSNGVTGCTTEASQTATGYVLHAGPECARGLPRSLQYGAIALAFGATQSDTKSDHAPDGQDMAAALEAASQGVVNRVAGTDRILTAIALSSDSVESGQAGAVVLAASQSFPDALAGGPLAYLHHAPMLLTAQTGLDPRVRTEMQRVLSPGGDVFVLGGTAALSDQVLTDVRAAGFTPKRVAGVNRFETAVAIADEFDSGDLQHQEVLIADGRTFTDALIAGAVAPTVAGVVLLTDGSTMPPATASYLGADNTDHVAIGTPASQAAVGVQHITGTDPSDLSVKVATELQPIEGIVAVASQATFADALAGGPFIAAFGGPLLLTDPQTLSAPAQAAIEAAAGSLREVVIFGGTAAVSPAAEQAITTALAQGQ
jgi:putative cell wall-binding protein